MSAANKNNVYLFNFTICMLFIFQFPWLCLTGSFLQYGVDRNDVTWYFKLVIHLGKKIFKLSSLNITLTMGLSLWVCIIRLKISLSGLLTCSLNYEWNISTYLKRFLFVFGVIPSPSLLCPPHLIPLHFLWLT